MRGVRVSTRMLVTLLVLAGSGRAVADPDPRDEVLKLLETEPQRTDYVVLLDTSAAMLRPFDATRKFLEDLVGSARIGDSIHFIAFNERAGELAIPVKWGTASAIKEALANVKQPHGAFADLGAGIDAVFDALEHPGAAPLALVFMVGTFCSTPPPGSPFSGEAEDGKPCRRVKVTDSLRQKSLQRLASRDQQVRVVAITIEPADPAGLETTRELFGNLDRVEANGAALLPVLDDLRRKVPYVRGALQVERILRGVPFSLTPATDALPLQGVAATELKVTSLLPLPVRLEPKKLRATDESLRFTLPGQGSAPDGQGDAPAPIDLPPLRVPAPREAPRAEPVPLAVRVENRPEHAERWSPSRPAREVEVEVVYGLELQPKEALAKLIGHEPRAEGTVKQALRFEYTPNRNDHPLTLAPADGRHRIIVPPGESREVALTLTSSVTWAELEASCAIAGEAQKPVTIPPGQGVPLTVVLRNDTELRPWRLAKEEAKDVAVSGECAVVTIAGDGSRLPATKYPLELTFTIAWKEGYAPMLVITVIAVLVAVLLLYAFEIRPRLEPPQLAGSLIIYDGPGDFRRLTVPLGGLKRVELKGVARDEGTPAIDGEKVVLPGSDTSAELYAEKYGKKSVIRLRKLEGDEVMFGESKIGVAPVDLRVGRSRFSVGHYHCRIE